MEVSSEMMGSLLAVGCKCECLCGCLPSSSERSVWVDAEVAQLPGNQKWVCV